MGWIKFGLLMAAQILLIGFIGDYVPESPALLISYVVWYVFVGFVVILSGISWVKEAQESGERSPKFTIVLSPKRVSVSLVIPIGLFLLALIPHSILPVPLILLTILLGPVAGTIILDRVRSFPLRRRKRQV